MPNERLHQKPSAKGGKRLALRNPRILCQKYGGACTTYQVCGFFLSWWGGPPQSFERSIWDRVGFYTIHTFLDPSVESQFRIISKSYNFLFGTTTTQSFTFSTSHFFSGQSWHASSSSIVLYLWLGARRPMAQSYDSGMVSRYYLGWSLHLHRGKTASKNLQQETQWPKWCLYKTPYYVAAPVRETGDVITRTPLYARLHSDRPTRTIFIFGSQVTRLSRDPSH